MGKCTLRRQCEERERKKKHKITKKNIKNKIEEMKEKKKKKKSNSGAMTNFRNDDENWIFLLWRSWNSTNKNIDFQEEEEDLKRKKIGSCENQSCENEERSSLSVKAWGNLPSDYRDRKWKSTIVYDHGHGANCNWRVYWLWWHLKGQSRIRWWQMIINDIG